MCREHCAHPHSPPCAVFNFEEEPPTYDMDSEDEAWLASVNKGASDARWVWGECEGESGCFLLCVSPMALTRGQATHPRGKV